MTTLNSRLQLALLKSKKTKNALQRGFTLIELMVVVAIVGVLSAVGLPQLLAAQDKAKDSAARAEVVSAAKTCSIDILTGSEGFVAADFPLVTGTCAASQTLTGTSTSSAGTTFTVDIDAGGNPGIVQEG